MGLHEDWSPLPAPCDNFGAGSQVTLHVSKTQSPCHPSDHWTSVTGLEPQTIHQRDKCITSGGGAPADLAVIGQHIRY